VTNKNNFLEVKNVKKVYQISDGLFSKKELQALRGIHFSVPLGKTSAIVGESGCGKSTLAKLVMQIEPITEGEILFKDQKQSAYSALDWSTEVQMIFQDPYSSINPRKKIKDTIAEPLHIHKKRLKISDKDISSKVQELASAVGLRPEVLERYPHMLSGGQRQRVGIARALTLNPKVLICDEPVSALDVSVQAQVINLLLDLQQKYNLTYIFISHDLGVVRFISDYVSVMYLGRIVEQGLTEEIFEDPKHPYTKLLLASSHLKHEQKSKWLEEFKSHMNAELPSPLNPPEGCSFHKRCPFAKEICLNSVPQLKRQLQLSSEVACHLY
jgi:oligopeptide/dipeptide ABC transporter ATP-binding protein